MIASNCSVVLVRTKFEGNLGSVARVMTNFGVTDMRLVATTAHPLSAEARALASHGEPRLEQARHFATLREAVSDCHWVAATSARVGGLFRKQNILPSREGMQLAARQSMQGNIALVFGPEDHGLTNDEVSLCHHLIHIPAHADYEVLNLAQAVGICLYEWFAASQAEVSRDAASPVPMAELEHTLKHLDEALRAIHFIWGNKADSVAHAIRHLLLRAGPTAQENKLLHGLARQILWYIEHHPPTVEERQQWAEDK